MSPGMIVFGAVLIGIGALLVFVVREKLGRKAVDVQYMRTSTIPDVKGMFSDMAASGLGGNLKQYVELQGAADAKEPQRTPYSDRGVAYYEAELFQVYEAEETYTDSEGKQQRRTVRREEAVSNEKSTEPLLIKDATGAALPIDLQAGGMELDLMEGYDRFESYENMGSFGFFHAFSPRHLGNRTLGYRMRESIIPLGQPLYVLGEAYLRGSDICIGKPSDPKKAFIVSTKSEAQIVSSAKAGSTWALAGGIVLAVGGVAAVIMGIF